MVTSVTGNVSTEGKASEKNSPEQRQCQEKKSVRCSEFRDHCELISCQCRQVIKSFLEDKDSEAFVEEYSALSFT